MRLSSVVEVWSRAEREFILIRLPGPVSVLVLGSQFLCLLHYARKTATDFEECQR
jgi:hypothetical protein